MPAAVGAVIAAAVLLAASFAAGAADFRSVGAEPAILYDAPSVKARKQFILSRQYPVEVVVVVQGFSKVRDAAGDFAWVESRLLSDKRTVLVRAASTEIRAAPDEKSPLVFQAQKDVVLELVEPPATGWARVRHGDGRSGYARLKELWGV
ncbi:MAG: SH3 domain-containing protein [Burkholderiales bacterium]